MIRISCYPTTKGVINKTAEMFGRLFAYSEKPYLAEEKNHKVQVITLEIENRLVTLKAKSGDIEKDFDVLEQIDIENIIDAKVMREDKKKFIYFATNERKYTFRLDNDLTKKHEEMLIAAFTIL